MSVRTVHLQTVTCPIASKCYKWIAVVGEFLPFLCRWEKKRIGNASDALNGSTKREKVGNFL